MSDTIKEFGKFISEDPIMLVLCIVVAILIVVFLLVLCFGGKKKKKEETKSIENTSQFLAADLNDEPLKSTQEFNLSNIAAAQSIETPVQADALSQTINVPNVEAIVEEAFEKDAPISVDEALSIKNERLENEVKNTIQIPVVNEEPETAVEVPVAPVFPEMPATPEVQTMSAPIEPVIPEVIPAETTEPVLEEVELPTMTQELQPVSSNTSSMQPFSSVYLNSSDEMPKMNDEEFSQTEIIRHIPAEESAPEMPVLNEQPAAPMDDLDLPKLNTDDKNSVLNSLTGETFDIK